MRISTALVGVVPVAAAGTALDLDSRSDILSSAQTLASDLMTSYHGDERGHTPGLLSGDAYYWWEAGAFMGTYVDYWYLTGDDSNNDAVRTGMAHQTGDDDDFMPANQTSSMGNDDQCIWALAAMQAAEVGFPGPNEDGRLSWIDVATNVYDEQRERLQQSDGKDECGGGLRWQIFPYSSGYDYKNTLSSGCLFNLAARLAIHTGNATYADTATDLWDWLTTVGLVDDDTWSVYDGINLASGCDSITKYQFSSSAAVLVHGAAAMYNRTGSDAWRTRTDKLVGSIIDTFFPDGVAYEPACEGVSTCNTDQVAYKGMTIRWLAGTARLAPFVAHEIQSAIQSTASVAVDNCDEDKSGWECAYYWNATGSVDSDADPRGIGAEMNALAAVSNMLFGDPAAPEDATGSGSTDSASAASDSQASSTSETAQPSVTPSAAGRVTVNVALVALAFVYMWPHT